ncbi:MAG: DUF2201 family putative metallopeptidase [Candidatus Thorarchaeota archaeon]
MKYDKVSSPEEAYLQTMIFLARAFPQLYFLSKYLRVTYNENSYFIARTDGKSIEISPRWLALPYHGRLAVFMHEIYHVLLKHPLRLKYILESGIDMETAQIACDAKVNYSLMLSLENAMSNPELYKDILRTFGIPEEMLEKASAEEIAKWLHKDRPGLAASVEPTAGIDIQPPSSGGGGSGEGDSESDSTDDSSGGSGKGKSDESESESSAGSGSGEEGDAESSGSSGVAGGTKVLNEGKKELLDATQDKLEEELSKVIRNSLISAKTAGAKLSAIEERILGQLTKAKVDWRSILRNWVNTYIKTNVIQSYIRPNRRFGHLPGQVSISRPRAWVFTDLSGSITPKEFKDFMTIVYHLQSHVHETRLITWDTKVTGEYTVTSKNKDELLRIRFAGGGGTTFSPVVSKYAKEIKPQDILICITDGVWFDVKEAHKIMKSIKALKILVTTKDEVPGFDKSVRIREVEV